MAVERLYRTNTLVLGANYTQWKQRFVRTPLGLRLEEFRKTRNLATRSCLDAQNNDTIPHELQGLRLDEHGNLVDESGKEINECGASRFDIAVRAMRGEFDPPKGISNTEHDSGVLLDSLVHWPSMYEFQFVTRSEGGENDPIVKELKDIVDEMCGFRGTADQIEVKPRKGGKYLSISIKALVGSPEVISNVFAAVDGDSRILMKY